MALTLRAITDIRAGNVLDSTVSQPSIVYECPRSEPIREVVTFFIDFFKMLFEERIDTHAHLLPPFYRQACIDAGHEKPDGMPELPVSIHMSSTD